MIRPIVVLGMLFTVAVGVALTFYGESQSKKDAAHWSDRHGLEYLVPYLCTKDCDDFLAGARWANDEDITDGDDCPETLSFPAYQGCLETVNYHAVADARDAQLARAEQKPQTFAEAPLWSATFMQQRLARARAAVDGN